MTSDYHHGLLLRLRHIAKILRGPEWGELSDTGQKLVAACLWAAMVDAVQEGLSDEVKAIMPAGQPRA